MSDTIKVYDKMVEQYVAIAEELPTTLHSFMQGLRPKSRVLDLGCGPGHHARMMAELGHDVLAVDASSEMIRYAQKQPGVTARQARFDDIPDLGTFDGVWASFSLLHASRADLPRHVSDIFGICAKGAIFSISLKLGKGEAIDKLGRFYSYYSQDELLMYLTKAGFSVGNIETGEDVGMAGHIEPWIGIEAHA